MKAEEQRQQIDNWLTQAQAALRREGKQTERQEFLDAAHYFEMMQLTLDEKLGKTYLKFETKDLGL